MVVSAASQIEALGEGVEVLFIDLFFLTMMTVQCFAIALQRIPVLLW